MNGLEGITEDLLERGCISAEDARVAQKYYSREGEMRKKAQKFIADKKLACPDPGERLAVTLCAAEIARVRYAERGISDSIFYDTMSDIGGWTADCRQAGRRRVQSVLLRRAPVFRKILREKVYRLHLSFLAAVSGQ